MLDIILLIFITIVGWFAPAQMNNESATSALFLPNTTTTASVIYVIDGDTIDVKIGTSTMITRVRYIGIDTPETRPQNSNLPECGSSAATEANKKLVAGKSVLLLIDNNPLDPYGRLLAYVFVGDNFINQELLREGYATTLSIKPNLRYQTEFSKLRNQAKSAKVGNWLTCSDWH